MAHKKQNYTVFWIILLILLLSFILLLADIFSPKNTPNDVFRPQKNKVDSINLSTQKELPKDTIPEGMDTTKQHILVTGDSMAKALGYGMTRYAQYNGHTITLFRWVSSSTKSWSETDSLRKLIEFHRPTYVIFTLGSNELPYKNIYLHEPYIRQIIEQFQDTKFVWVGPPNWKPDTGINAFIEKNTPQGCFFLSKNLKIARMHDNIHPNNLGADQWADTLASWIMQEARYKIMLRKPPDDFQATRQSL